MTADQGLSEANLRNLARIYYEATHPPHDTPAGGFTRWATWEEASQCGDVVANIERGLRAVFASLSTPPAQEPAAVVEALALELKLAAETFRRYETLHRAKDTAKGLAKATANANAAARIERLLASLVAGASRVSIDPPGAMWRPISELKFDGRKIIALDVTGTAYLLYANPEWKPEAHRIYSGWREDASQTPPASDGEGFSAGEMPTTPSPAKTAGGET